MKKSKARHFEVKIDKRFIDIIKNLLVIFKDDSMKVKWWLTTKKLNFGGVSPIFLIGVGKIKAVQDFMNSTVEEGYRDKPREWVLALDQSNELSSYGPITEIVEGEHLKPGEKIRVREVLPEKMDLTAPESGDETDEGGTSP